MLYLLAFNSLLIYMNLLSITAIRRYTIKTAILVLLFNGSLLFGQMVTGTYVGNGAASQIITGIGISPSAIIVIPSTGGSITSTIQTWVHSSSMPVGYVKYTQGGNSVANSFKTGFLTSLESDGFTVGSNANVSGTSYYYTVWSDSDGSVTTGTFTGNTTSQNVALGYQPTMVWLFSDAVLSPDYLKWTHSSRTTGTYRFSHGDAGWGEYSFNGFSPIGFTVHGSSTGGSGILNGSTYHYIAFQAEIGVASVGYGSGPTKVTTTFAPDFIMTRHRTTHGNNTYIKTSDMPSTHSFIPRHETRVTDGIQNFESDGYSTGSTGQLRSQHYYIGLSSISTLPVEFTVFQAKENDEGTLITWTTLTETNNNHFELFGSYDSRSWELITTVKGAGDSDTLINYAELIPKKKHLYYKIVQIDLNGTSTTSKVINVKRNLDDLIQLVSYPNPVGNQLNFATSNIGEGFYSIRISTINGELVFNQRYEIINGDIESVNVNRLPVGFYMLMVTSQSGKQFSMKFVKE